MSDHVITDVERVEIDQRRWYADIRVVKRDGVTETIHVCADAGHSGLWLGDPADHEDE